MPSPIDDFARAAGEAYLAAILQPSVADPRGPPRLRIDMRNIGDVDRQLLFDDPARLAHAWPSMPLGDMHSLDDEPPFVRENPQDLAGPALVAAADHDHVVALLDFQLQHLFRSRRS